MLKQIQLGTKQFVSSKLMQEPYDISGVVTDLAVLLFPRKRISVLHSTLGVSRPMDVPQVGDKRYLTHRFGTACKKWFI